MKKCDKCGYENSDESNFCEDCGSSEFMPQAEQQQQQGSDEIKIGDNSAISTGELVSGGKNNTTNTTTNDNSTTTNISNGTSAEDMANILRVVMQENNNTIKQVLEQQQEQLKAQAEQQAQAQAEQQPKSAETKGSSPLTATLTTVADAVPAEEAKEEYNEYELVAMNLYNSLDGLYRRFNMMDLPQKSFYMKRYQYLVWITATIFCFLMAAATAINVIWFFVLGSLAMTIFSVVKKFTSKVVDTKDEAFKKYLEDYASLRSTIVATFGENNEIVYIGDSAIKESTEKFEAAQRGAIKGARVTTAIICVTLLAVAYLVVNIVVA